VTDSISISETGLPNVVSFKPDGTKMYISDDTGNTYQYALSTAWSVSTATYENKMHNPNESEFTFAGKVINGDGNSLYSWHTGLNRFLQHTLSTAWDVSTATLTATYEFSFPDDWVYFYVTPNGGSIIISSLTSNRLYLRPISTPYRISTIGAISDSISFASQMFTYSLDGLYLYRAQGSSIRVSEDKPTTAHGIRMLFGGTSSLHRVSSSYISMYVGDSGTKLYVTNNNFDKIYQYQIIH
jgi:hypothetical protein